MSARSTGRWWSESAAGLELPTGGGRWSVGLSTMRGAEPTLCQIGGQAVAWLAGAAAARTISQNPAVRRLAAGADPDEDECDPERRARAHRGASQTDSKGRLARHFHAGRAEHRSRQYLSRRRRYRAECFVGRVSGAGSARVRVWHVCIARRRGDRPRAVLEYFAGGRFEAACGPTADSHHAEKSHAGIRRGHRNDRGALEFAGRVCPLS